MTAENCLKCPLAATRNNVVQGRGNPNAPVILVGEGPGADEDQQGRAFVGRSGKMLDGVLIELGIHEEDVFITNAVRCRPPDNRVPSYNERRACEAYLRDELSTGARVVALGRTSDGLLNDMDVPHEHVEHPAYILRNPLRRAAWKTKVRSAIG